jgi:hypothetical protein
MSFITNYWKGHGTKILGGVTAALGGVGTLLVAYPEQCKLIFGERGYAIATVGVGACVTIIGPALIKRGFTNSANK